MRITTIFLGVTALFVSAAFTPIKKLTVTSTAFVQNGPIPVKYTCLGQQASPPLNIANIPEGAVSLAIIVDDPDGIVTKSATHVSTTTHVAASKGSSKKRTTTKRTQTTVTPEECGYINWMIWNIEIDANIPENFKNSDEGMNSAKQTGYTGMCPHSGTHYYHFRVYALDTKLNISKTCTKAELEKVMEGHIVAKGELVGIFNKTYK
jgi:phosphatidylethanolamine-binding protein (PEBP) family uncharacterized protein